MSAEKNTPVTEVPALIKKAPELLPLWDWWVKEGKSTLTILGIAAVLVGGYYGVRHYMAQRYAAANQALAGAYTAEDLEAAVSSYGSTKVGPAIKLRLAKSYYDTARYEEALVIYDELTGASLADGAFDDLALIGRAYCLEALGKYADAQKVFADYAADESNTSSYLLLTAQMGAARAQALGGEKDAALKRLEALKTAKKGDALAESRLERLIDMLKRHDPNRKAPSLFDAANAAEKALKKEAAPKKEAAKPVAEKAAQPAAPAAKK